ncbi:MAG: hypothetical protein AMXMBFR25_28200 [Lysobacterales bacterium]|nr:Adaptive-response sensory-kinase SasA [Xanthomonadales bacterium]
MRSVSCLGVTRWLQGLLVACTLSTVAAVSIAQADPEALATAVARLEDSTAPLPRSVFMDEAVQLLNRAEAADDAVAAARIELAIARHLRSRGLWEEVEAHGRAAATQARRAGDQRLLARAELAIAGAQVQLESLPQAQELLLDVLARARVNDDAEAQALALLSLSSAAGRARDLETARRYADEGVAIASAADLAEAWLRLLINRIRIVRAQSQPELALADLETALSLAARVSAPDALQSLLLAEIAVREPEDAQARLQAVVADAARRQQPYLQAFALVVAGRSLCERGDTAEGAEQLRAGVALLRELDTLWDLSAALADLGACAHRAGDFAQAYAHAVEARSTALDSLQRRREDVVASLNLRHREHEQAARLTSAELRAEQLALALAQRQRDLAWLLAVACSILLLAAWLGFRLRLRALQARAAAAEQQARVQVLAMTSHEIRNPVQGLRGTLEQLLQQEVDPARRRQLHSAHLAADVIARLASDALDLALIEQGRFTLHRHPCDLDALVRASLALVEATARAKGLGLRYEPAAAPGWAEVDPERFGQVLLNLVGNAVHYSGSGEVLLRARIDLLARLWTLEVCDRGPGVADAELERIFEPGFRGSASSGAGGSGLGLAIARRLVEAHGGRLWARPGQAEGAVFVLELPCSDAASEPQADGLPLAGRRVLLVDDDEFSRLGIRSLLEVAGAQVRELADAVTLDEGLRSFVPDILLCDRHLGGSDGGAIAASVRARRTGSLPQVLLVSGSGGPSGVDGLRVLPKPFSIEQLMQALAAESRA